MWIFGWKGESGFSARSTAEEVSKGIDASGLTAVVTGASSGIGIETTRVLARCGARVIMAVRNVENGQKVKETIAKEILDAKIDVLELDLSCLASVRKFASDFNSLALPLNLLINNAGIMAPPFMLSKDNIESQFATNHLGHFLLTNLLLDNMKKATRECQTEGKIVNVSSSSHKFVYSGGIYFDKINDSASYNSMRAYGQSKLANILHANELARQFKEEGVQITANSLHPGGIATNITRHHSIIDGVVRWVGKYAIKSILQGAATTCYVALHPQVKGASGEYFCNSNIGQPSSLAKDADLAKKLWDFSLNMTEPK